MAFIGDPNWVDALLPMGLSATQVSCTSPSSSQSVFLLSTKPGFSWGVPRKPTAVPLPVLVPVTQALQAL